MVYHRVPVLVDILFVSGVSKAGGVGLPPWAPRVEKPCGLTNEAWKLCF